MPGATFPQARFASLAPAHMGVVAHTGGVITGRGLARFHSGGLVGQGGLFSAGLRPDEIVAKLQTGEAVLPRHLVRELRTGSGKTSNSTTAISIGAVNLHGKQDVDHLARTLAWQEYAYSKGG